MHCKIVCTIQVNTCTHITFLFYTRGVILSRSTSIIRMIDIFRRVSKKMIHFSIGNIFVNPGDTAMPNISLDTSLCGISPCLISE